MYCIDFIRIENVIILYIFVCFTHHLYLLTLEAFLIIFVSRRTRRIRRSTLASACVSHPDELKAASCTPRGS